MDSHFESLLKKLFTENVPSKVLALKARVKFIELLKKSDSVIKLINNMVEFCAKIAVTKKSAKEKAMLLQERIESLLQKSLQHISFVLEKDDSDKKSQQEGFVEFFDSSRFSTHEERESNGAEMLATVLTRIEQRSYFSPFQQQFLRAAFSMIKGEKNKESTSFNVSIGLKIIQNLTRRKKAVVLRRLSCQAAKRSECEMCLSSEYILSSIRKKLVQKDLYCQKLSKNIDSLQDTQIRFDDLKEKYANLRLESEQQKIQLQSFKQADGSASTSIQTLQETLLKSRVAEQKLKEENSSLKSTILELESERLHLITEKKSVEASLAEINTMKEEINSLKNENDEMKLNKGVFTKSHNSELLLLKNENEMLRKEVENAEVLIKDLTEINKTNEMELKKKMGDFNDFYSECDELKSQVTFKNRGSFLDMSPDKTHRYTFQSEHTQYLDEMTETITNLQARIIELETKSFDKEIASAKKDSQGYENEIKRLESESKAKEPKLYSANKRLSQQRQTSELELSETNEISNQLISELREEIRKLKRDLEILFKDRDDGSLFRLYDLARVEALHFERELAKVNKAGSVNKAKLQLARSKTSLSAAKQTVSKQEKEIERLSQLNNKLIEENSRHQQQRYSSGIDLSTLEQIITTIADGRVILSASTSSSYSSDLPEILSQLKLYIIHLEKDRNDLRIELNDMQRFNVQQASKDSLRENKLLQEKIYYLEEVLEKKKEEIENLECEIETYNNVEEFHPETHYSLADDNLLQRLNTEFSEKLALQNKELGNLRGENDELKQSLLELEQCVEKLKHIVKLNEEKITLLEDKNNSQNKQIKLLRNENESYSLTIKVLESLKSENKILKKELANIEEMLQRDQEEEGFSNSKRIEELEKTALNFEIELNRERSLHQKTKQEMATFIAQCKNLSIKYVQTLKEIEGNKDILKRLTKAEEEKKILTEELQGLKVQLLKLQNNSSNKPTKRIQEEALKDNSILHLNSYNFSGNGSFERDSIPRVILESITLGDENDNINQRQVKYLIASKGLSDLYDSHDQYTSINETVGKISSEFTAGESVISKQGITSSNMISELRALKSSDTGQTVPFVRQSRSPGPEYRATSRQVSRGSSRAGSPTADLGVRVFRELPLLSVSSLNRPTSTKRSSLKAHPLQQPFQGHVGLSLSPNQEYGNWGKSRPDVRRFD